MTPLSYKTIKESEVFEIVVKKSRFIATIFPAQSDEEAQIFLAKLKKQYQDASHNVFAYTVGLAQKIERQSDDGEPSGTAGKPALEVIRNLNLSNVCINITRYFGGIMLGAGGLTRAYRESAVNAFNNAKCLEMKYHSVLELSLPYTYYDKLMRVINKHSYIIKKSNFLEAVSLDVSLPSNLVDEFCIEITNLCVGDVNIIQKNSYYESFIAINNKPKQHL